MDYLTVYQFFTVMKKTVLHHSSASTQRKKEGFRGQQAIVIPRKILAAKCGKNATIKNMYITDIGYYPRAEFHYRKRSNGAEQHIFIYCIDGKGTVTIGKNGYSIEAGDFFIVPKKTAHAYKADDTHPWTIYWLHFTGAVADSITALLQQQHNGHKGFKQYDEKTITLFNDMYRQLERGYSTAHLVYSNMCLWHFLAGFIYTNIYAAENITDATDSSNIAISFLSRHLEKTLTLEAIAAAVNLSPSHFSFVFKQKTGFSPIDYFNHLKIQKACQYLLFTRLRINEIAAALGIDDPSYFSRLFTKVMGISPKLYRERRIH